MDTNHTLTNNSQRFVYVLSNLNEATVKRQTTYEDLHMLKSVVRSQDWMLSLDVESAFTSHSTLSIESSFRHI
jgi:hypothetical protein